MAEFTIDGAVARQVAIKAGKFVRLAFEALFIGLVAYLLVLPGRNFFFDAPWRERESADLCAPRRAEPRKNAEILPVQK